MKRTHNRHDRRSAAQMHALAAVRREIRSRDSASSSKYLREFTTAFRSYDATITSEQLDERLTAADIVLVGDYHALPASQRFAASLVERLAGTRPVVVGVEAVLSRDQTVLDQWWRREISEQALRERLRYDREWGYEWAPFYDLLIAAREHADGIYGLDCLPRHDLRRIRGRDRHAAAKIREMRERHANAALVVLFGESHLAPEHLPRELVRALPDDDTGLTVLQNLDPIYWQAIAENAATVSLSSDAVCVFNSSPLEKYESYRICLEKWHNDDASDFTPAVHNMILSLARTLGFRADSPRNGTQPKQLADSLPEVVSADDALLQSGLSENDRATLDEGGCVYVPQTNIFYIHELKTAQAAAECARFLHCACKGFATHYAPSDLEDTLAYLGARLLCPGSLHEDIKTDKTGAALYDAYLGGKISKAALRRMFLVRGQQVDLIEKLRPAMQC